MGGLYNIVFGSTQEGPLLVALLESTMAGEQEFDTGRLRDAWLEIAGDWLEIHVYTRNGGGNRQDQAAAIESMRAHPWYVRDADDSFDITYASFWFRVPDELTNSPGGQSMAKLAVHPVDMSERWQKMIDALNETSDGD